MAKTLDEQAITFRLRYQFSQWIVSRYIKTIQCTLNIVLKRYSVDKLRFPLVSQQKKLIVWRKYMTPILVGIIVIAIIIVAIVALSAAGDLLPYALGIAAIVLVLFLIGKCTLSLLKLKVCIFR